MLPALMIKLDSLCTDCMPLQKLEICCLDLQVEKQQCALLADDSQPAMFQLALDAPASPGPGLLTVSVEQTSLVSSMYVQFEGCASHVSVDLSKPNPQTQVTTAKPLAGTASLTLDSDTGLGPQSSLTLPTPLTYGGAIQLQTPHSTGHMTGLPYYAVSEEVLMRALHSGAVEGLTHCHTLFDGSLLGTLGPKAHDHLTCPASTYLAMDRRQPQPQDSIMEVDVQKPVSSRLHESASALLPWCLCGCLLLCTVALALHHRYCCHTAVSDCSSMPAAVSQAELSCIRSNQELITPTKDTGCSPFVPLSRVPVPQFPFGHAHLASCSSKIGSHKAARPATSRAVTNMTSNVSGCTKWQRSKNGRLLSSDMVDPDEHTS